MAKNTQNLKPDIVLKNYWNDNEHFADFFNAILFAGEPVIKPDELEEIDTEESFIQEHREFSESIQASRDSIKIHRKSVKYDVQLVLLGQENQERIHYAMPMRTMGYDYSVYKKQYDANAKKYQKKSGLSDDEFLSKMKKTDKLVPVVTVTVYYGEKPWDGAKSLHGMLDIPQEMKPYVNDYKILLVEARQNALKFHNVDNQDLFQLFHIMLNQNLETKEAKKKLIQYCEEHNTDKSVIMALAGAVNVKINYNNLRKDDNDMCRVFEEIAAEARAEGKTEGKAEGAQGMIQLALEFGLSENEILQKLQKNLSVSFQKAQEYFEMFGKRTV